MPAILAHFCVLEKATQKIGVEGIRKALMAPPNFSYVPRDLGISQFAYLGAIGPDIAGYESSLEWLFEVFHYKKTNSFVKAWLADPGGGDAALAFILGFLAHMAADVVIHPYVNTFAGVYEQQLIEWAVTPTKAGVSPLAGPLAAAAGTFMAKKQRCQMHRFVELHQDVNVCQSYYNLTVELREMETAAQQSRITSWANFIKDTLEPAHQSAFDPVANKYDAAVQKTYDSTLTGGQVFAGFKPAVKTLYKLLDIVFDWAFTPVPSAAQTAFVEHLHKDRAYSALLDK